MNWELLIAALIQVESSGDYAAINKEEQAFGLLQIRPCIVEDVNRLYGTNYQHTRYLMSRPEYIIPICKQYLIYWGGRYEGETGLRPSYEVYARIWNGGPRGVHKDSTVTYWNKVKGVIEKELGRELKVGE